MAVDRSTKGVDPFDLVGSQLMGRYTVEERLARGGMSVLYRGHDERLKRPVCVKVFFGLDPTRPSYRAVYDHFVQEAFALSQLGHPNTLRIYDFGYLEDERATPFQVAELLEGGTLAGYIRRKQRLSLEESLHVLEVVAGALSEAHASGIVHRDIKPSNILFGRAGAEDVVKLADFGIAKAFLGSSAASRFPHGPVDTAVTAHKGLAFYSLSWAAPEQLRGLAVTPAADVFALGLVVAFMLTGEQVFPEEGEFIQTFDMRMEGDALLDRILEDMALDEPVREVIRHACRDDVGARIATPLALIEALVEANAAVQNDDTAQELDALVDAGAVEIIDASVPVLVVQSTRSPEMLAAGRRVRLIEVPQEVVLGAGAGFVQSPARLRITLLPQAGEGARLHVKGLNCFVAKNAGRPSSAADLWEGCDLELCAPNRATIDRMQVLFGRLEGDARSFALQSCRIEVPLRVSRTSVALDYGPGREIVLLYQAPRNGS